MHGIFYNIELLSLLNGLDFRLKLVVILYYCHIMKWILMHLRLHDCY